MAHNLWATTSGFATLVKYNTTLVSYSGDQSSADTHVCGLSVSADW